MIPSAAVEFTKLAHDPTAPPWVYRILMPKLTEDAAGPSHAVLAFYHPGDGKWRSIEPAYAIHTVGAGLIELATGKIVSRHITPGDVADAVPVIEALPHKEFVVIKAALDAAADAWLANTLKNSGGGVTIYEIAA